MFMVHIHVGKTTDCQSVKHVNMLHWKHTDRHAFFIHFRVKREQDVVKFNVLT